MIARTSTSVLAESGRLVSGWDGGLWQSVGAAVPDVQPEVGEILGQREITAAYDADHRVDGLRQDGHHGAPLHGREAV